MLLIDYAREVVGLPMRALFLHRHYGWTTDRTRAELMREAGAHVEAVPSADQRPEARRFDGWEISFAVGREKWDGTSAYQP